MSHLSSHSARVVRGRLKWVPMPASYTDLLHCPVGSGHLPPFQPPLCIFGCCYLLLLHPLGLGTGPRLLVALLWPPERLTLALSPRTP